MPSHSSHARNQRDSLADALLAAGPDAPTLCAGWTTRDLAAHLVVREGRADAALGIVLPPLAGYGEKVRRKVAQRPYEGLVQRFRSKPLLSWARLPLIEPWVNHGEYFVHTEDVLRAQPGPHRELPADEQAALWAGLGRNGKLLFRNARCGVQLVWPQTGKERKVKGGKGSVVLRGTPGELLLYGFGRRDAADVAVEGPDDVVAAFRKVRLGL